MSANDLGKSDKHIALGYLHFCKDPGDPQVQVLAKASILPATGVATKANYKLDIKRGWGKAAVKTWCHIRTGRESNGREQITIWLGGRARCSFCRAKERENEAPFCQMKN